MAHARDLLFKGALDFLEFEDLRVKAGRGSAKTNLVFSKDGLNREVVKVHLVAVRQREVS
jgi:hypothetical protein